MSRPNRLPPGWPCAHCGDLRDSHYDYCYTERACADCLDCRSYLTSDPAAGPVTKAEEAS